MPAYALVGVEAAGAGLDTGRHSASISAGQVGVLHGKKTYILQDETGQIRPAHSISAGLDYPGVGPEHAYLHATGRAEYVTATDAEAIDGLQLLAETEGIIPALETAHAVAHAAKLAPQMRRRPDPDRQRVRTRRQGHDHRRELPGRDPVMSTNRIDRTFAALRARNAAALIPFLTAGDPDLGTTGDLMRVAVRAARI